MFFEAMIIAGLGGFVGSACRWLTGLLGKALFGSKYPAGTFIANILGCFIIGLFFGIWGRHEMSPLMNQFLITRFCGGYTTFSSFSHDNIALLQKKQTGTFLLYILPSLIFGPICVWLGMICI